MATLEINGRKVEVDDSFRSLSPEQQQATVEEIAASLPQAATEPQAKTDYRGDGLAGTRLGAGIAGAADTLTLGFGDQLKSAGWAAIDAIGPETFGESYDKRLAQEHGMIDQMKEENGGSYLTGQIGGALLLPGASLKTGGSMATNALRAGLSSGAQGGAYGFGNDRGDLASRARSAGDGAAMGFAAGAAAPFVLKGLQGVATRRATRKAVDVAADAASAETAKAGSKAAFAAAEAKNAVLKAETLTPLLAEIAQTKTLHKRFTPDANSLIDDIQEALSRGEVPLGELEDLHRSAGMVATKNRMANGQEVAAAGEIGRKIDEFLMALPDDAVASATGDAQGAADAFREGRKLWKQFRNSEKLHEIVDNAAMKDNPALAVKNGFANILSNKKKRATYSASELQVMRQVVDETKAGSWVQRLIGYGTGLSRQVAAVAAGSAVGGHVGAALGSMAATKLGSMAKGAASDTAIHAGRRAADFVAGGGQFVQPAPSMLPGWGNALRATSQIAAPVGVNALNR
jgi:hypothetical protein